MASHSKTAPRGDAHPPVRLKRRGSTIVTDQAGRRQSLSPPTKPHPDQLPAENQHHARTPFSTIPMATSSAAPGRAIRRIDYDASGNSRSSGTTGGGNKIRRTYGRTNECGPKRSTPADPDRAARASPRKTSTNATLRCRTPLRYVSAPRASSQYEYDRGRQTRDRNAGTPNIAASTRCQHRGSTLNSGSPGSTRTTARRPKRLRDYRGAVSIVTKLRESAPAGCSKLSPIQPDTYTYAQSGTPDRVISGSSARSLVYDGLGRMTQATDFNGGITRTSFPTRSADVITHARLSRSRLQPRGELSPFSGRTPAQSVQPRGWRAIRAACRADRRRAGLANYSDTPTRPRARRWALTDCGGVPIRSGQLEPSGKAAETIPMKSPSTRASIGVPLQLSSARWTSIMSSRAAARRPLSREPQRWRGQRPSYSGTLPGSRRPSGPDKGSRWRRCPTAQGAPTSSAPIGGRLRRGHRQKVLDLYFISAGTGAGRGHGSLPLLRYYGRLSEDATIATSRKSQFSPRAGAAPMPHRVYRTTLSAGSG